MNNNSQLAELGWQPFFQQQLSLEEWEQYTVARIIGHERTVITLMTSNGKQHIRINHTMPALTVGDWVLLDDDHFYRLLDRVTIFTRKTPGTKVDTQLIVANVETVLVLSSLNQDFNLNRIERYLSLIHEAGAEAVIILTKADLVTDVTAIDDYVKQVQALDPLLTVISLNSLDPESVHQLLPWCSEGKTVALLGSSGVGKSSLVNTLLEKKIQLTRSIRDDDAKGRHTTTARSLHLLSIGGILIDTPGMRELQLHACEQGIEDTFKDIVGLAVNCKFNDCSHQNEPGCAIRSSIESGNLEQRRLDSYHKLMKEQAFNQATLAEKRARDKSLGQYYKSVQSTKRHLYKD